MYLIHLTTVLTVFLELIMAGRETKLTHKMVGQICRFVRLRLKIVEIAAILHVDPSTIHRWIREGENAKKGVRRKLVDGIASAKAEVFSELSDIVFNAALVGSETETEKVIKYPNGETRTETTTKRTPPDAAEARRILALMQPERWAEVKHIRYEWRESVEGLGLDPKKIEEMLFKHLQKSQEEGSESPPIPELPGRTV